MRIFFADHITVPLPENHRFPMAKYAMLHHALVAEGVLQPEELVPAVPATRAQVTAAHTPEYFDAFVDGSLAPEVIREIGIPWSPEFVRRTLASMGGSISAARQALQDGFSGNLAGGTHHALSGRGGGFCVFNDIAIVSKLLLQEGAVGRIAVVDLDVHQGNGTAAILAGEPRMFLFSMHGQKNFPFRKVPSTLDIGLPDNASDSEFLASLNKGLDEVRAFSPDLVIYQAGVDPLQTDRLGRLGLTMNGLAERDRMVLQLCRDTRISVVMLMGGGYAKPIEDTVLAHVQSYRVARQVFSSL